MPNSCCVCTFALGSEFSGSSFGCMYAAVLMVASNVCQASAVSCSRLPTMLNYGHVNCNSPSTELIWTSKLFDSKAVALLLLTPLAKLALATFASTSIAFGAKNDPY